MDTTAPANPGDPPDAKKVVELWEKADRSLIEDRRHYWLNMAFYLGQQWVQWDRTKNTMQVMPDNTRKLRATIDRVGPAVDNLLGRLLKRDLAFEGQQAGTDDVAMRGSKLAEFICEACRRDLDWESARTEAMLGVLLGGTAGVCVEWDPTAGETVAVDPADGTSKLQLGQAKVSPLSIAEYSLEPYSRRAGDARYWVKATTLTPEQAQDVYKLDKTPQPDGKAASTPLQSKLLAQRQGVDGASQMCTVFTYYERPTNRSDGWVVVVIGNETVVEPVSWPFPFPHLNLYSFRQRQLGLGWTGATFVSAARSPQAHYNMVRSVGLDHANKTQNARLLVPFGAVDDADEFSNEVGEVTEYHSEVGGKIEWMSPPEYQRQIAEEANKLASELDDILHTHATSQGELSGDRNSGLALSLVAEKDDSPLGIMARDQANGWGQIGTMVLKLYEANTIEERTTRVRTDANVTVERVWKGADLHGQTTVTVPIDATMPHSRVATQAMLTGLAQSFPQMFAAAAPRQLATLLDVPNFDMLPAVLDPDSNLAQWENEMMSQGSAMVPQPWNNHAKHIAEHNAERNSPAYEAWDENEQSIMNMHITAHEKMAAEEVATQGQLEQAAPGLSQLPQGDQPPGSAVPPPLSVIQGGQAGGPPQQPPPSQPPQQQPAPPQGAVGQ